jgi:uncharacterized surface protein with fasciclin (FAS1) repeats
MINDFSKNLLLRLLKLGAVLVVGLFFLLTACDSDDVGGNLYTFTGQTIGKYLSDNSAVYSEFTQLLDTTDVLGLLKSYGEYTCFAPTNDAMYAYYTLKGKTKLSDFTLDTLKLVAYDHLIDGDTLRTSDFQEGRLSQLSMSGRYFSISYGDTGDIYINSTSRILQANISVSNGIIHKISEVLNPTRDGVVSVISKDSNFTLFYEALLATGLADSLLKIEDDTYDPDDYEDMISVTKDDGLWYYQEIPSARKYGYTVFMETNDVMANNNITSLSDLKTYAASVYDEIYPDDASITDVTNRSNSLNRFIAYHLINKELSYTKLISAYDTDHMIKTRDMYEYIETMCPNTLIEVSLIRNDGDVPEINRLPDYDDSYLLVDKTNYDNDALNGVYHAINGMLVYSKNVDDMLSTKRLRFDAASFFPELTNNNMRGYGETLPNLKFLLPRGYIDRLTTSEQTVVGYLTPYYMYQDYEGDEIYLNSEDGKLYDFTIETPPVPAGTYEVRFGYLTNGKRGVAQLYFDEDPAGVPLNLNTSADDASIGWVEPETDEDDYYGYENDKLMRNHGYMKGPASYKVPTTGWTYGKNARYCEASLRKILGTYTFDSAGTHLFTVKGLSGGEFMFDYLEFVPTSIVESEDIY